MTTEQIITPAPVFRHPLGLPAGSVRAAMASMIAVLFWLLLLLPPNKPVTVPLYLYFLLALVLVFFAAHGHSIAPAGVPHRSPWGLPRGTFRWLLFLGSVAVVAWVGYRDLALLEERLTPRPDRLDQWPHLLLALMGGFFLGWLIGRGPWRNLYWYQDVQAWISLVAMILLGVEIVVQVFINPNLDREYPNHYLWEQIVVALVSLYFGARS